MEEEEDPETKYRRGQKSCEWGDPVRDSLLSDVSGVSNSIKKVI